MHCKVAVDAYTVISAVGQCMCYRADAFGKLGREHAVNSVSGTSETFKCKHDTVIAALGLGKPRIVLAQPLRYLRERKREAQQG